MPAYLLLLLILLCSPLQAAPESSEPSRARLSSTNQHAWPRTAFPLKVFIDPLPEQASAHRSDYRQAILDAMQAWNQIGVMGLSAFTETKDRANADVLIAWQLEVDADKGGFEQSRTARTGRSVNFSQSFKSKVTLVIEHWRRRQIPTGLLGFFLPVPVPNLNTAGVEQRGSEEIRLLATHELGHSLGLLHSEDKNDIMFPVEGEKFVLYGFEFTNIQVLTETSRQRLQDHYRVAWQEFSGTAPTPEPRTVATGEDSRPVVAATGRTTLIEAAEKGVTAEVERLLNAGSDINGRDESGWTPLIAAAGEGHTETVALLLQKGANLQARDGNGYTALRHAKANGHIQVVELLTRAGAKL